MASTINRSDLSDLLTDVSSHNCWSLSVRACLARMRCGFAWKQKATYNIFPKSKIKPTLSTVLELMLLRIRPFPTSLFSHGNRKKKRKTLALTRCVLECRLRFPHASFRWRKKLFMIRTSRVSFIRLSSLKSDARHLWWRWVKCFPLLEWNRNLENVCCGSGPERLFLMFLALGSTRGICVWWRELFFILSRYG